MRFSSCKLENISDYSGDIKLSRYSEKGINWKVILFLIVLPITIFLISFALGRFPIAPKDLVKILLSRFFDIEKTWTDYQETVVFNIRLPRVLVAMLVGAALSAAGAAYQGLFKNPLVSGDILGASAGAGFGACLAISLSLSSAMIQTSAFIFSIIAVALVYILSLRMKGNQTLGLVLSGILMGNIFQAGTSFLKYVADTENKLPEITFWLLGDLSKVMKGDVLLALIPITVAIIPLMIVRWKINVMTLGDEEAQCLGINTKFIRAVVVICSTLLTATAVSVSGMIGWVSLVVPHLARMIVGPDYKVLLPVSTVMGACYLLIVDDLARLVAAVEIPLGILTSLVGAPFFLYLIMSRKEE